MLMKQYSFRTLGGQKLKSSVSMISLGSSLWIPNLTGEGLPLSNGRSFVNWAIWSSNSETVLMNKETPAVKSVFPRHDLHVGEQDKWSFEPWSPCLKEGTKMPHQNTGTGCRWKDSRNPAIVLYVLQSYGVKLCGFKPQAHSILPAHPGASYLNFLYF